MGKTGLTQLWIWLSPGVGWEPLQPLSCQQNFRWGHCFPLAATSSQFQPHPLTDSHRSTVPSPTLALTAVSQSPLLPIIVLATGSSIHISLAAALHVLVRQAVFCAGLQSMLRARPPSPHHPIVCCAHQAPFFSPPPPSAHV